MPPWSIACGFALALTGGIALGLGIDNWWPGGCSLFNLKLQLSATPEKAAELAASCSHATRSDVVAALGWDMLFVVCYGYVLGVSLYLLGRQVWRMEGTRAAASLLANGVILAMILDVSENVALFVATWDWEGLGDGTYGPWTRIMFALAAAAAWLKWAIVLAAIGLLIVLLLGCFGYSGLPPAAPTARPEVAALTPSDAELGIAVSGGGMRSATFSLGVLRSLDRRGVLQRARWLAAVSGGAYTAGAWFLARHDANVGVTPTPVPEEDGWYQDGVLSLPRDATAPAPEPEDPASLYQYLRKSRRYLSAGRGGVPLAFLKATLFLVINVAVLYTVLWLAVRPFGWLVGSEFIAPALADGVTDDEARTFMDDLNRHTLPTVIALVPSSACAVGVWAWLRPGQQPWTRGAAALGGAALALLVTLYLIPLLMWKVPEASAFARTWLELYIGPALLLLGPLVILGAAVMGLLRPAAWQFSRFGGCALGFLVLVLAGQWATNAACLGPGGLKSADGKPRCWPSGTGNRKGMYFDPLARLAGDFHEGQAWGTVVVFLLFAGVFVNQRWWSLHVIYKRALRNTFCPTYSADRRSWFARAKSDSKVWPLRSRLESSEKTWDRMPTPGGEYKESGPELLICAAVNTSGSSASGIPANSFVFSPTVTGWYGPGGTPCLVPTKNFVAALPGLKAFRASQGTVSHAVSVTGAAVASAMGRSSLGTTNSLLAVFNLRLGVWLPNPARINTAPEEADGRRFATPKLTYLLKEVFGRYHVADDPYVYVSDGGHWENLGVVELVRRRCQVIVSADAGKDVGALEKAIALAESECGATITPEFESLQCPGGAARPATNVAVMSIDYAGDEEPQTGYLVYGRLQVAKDSDDRLKKFQAGDRTFPNYATFDLSLCKEQFEHMVLLGEEVGTRLAARTRELLGQ
ncbi:hypothetical protein ACM01_03880 [Streptomyces viridochromogenes]|uniref:Uncharacterized protein n=1 Tax=Streptomyces viridochromogenes TaxID=1938 RepID=A0A0J7ZLT3_STRVR|nr:hypothetical protein ACM01_03880 [Streptomyces viridochromogenes]